MYFTRGNKVYLKVGSVPGNDLQCSRRKSSATRHHVCVRLWKEKEWLHHVNVTRMFWWGSYFLLPLPRMEIRSLRRFDVNAETHWETNVWYLSLYSYRKIELLSIMLKRAISYKSRYNVNDNIILPAYYCCHSRVRTTKQFGNHISCCSNTKMLAVLQDYYHTHKVVIANITTELTKKCFSCL